VICDTSPFSGSSKVDKSYSKIVCTDLSSELKQVPSSFVWIAMVQLCDFLDICESENDFGLNESWSL
jgi:hypothetical protein